MSHIATLSNRLKSSIVKSKTLGQFSIFSKSLVIGVLTFSFLLGGMQFARPKIEVKADPLTPSCGNNTIVTNPTFNNNGVSVAVGNYLYVSDATKISIIDITTNLVTTTIPAVGIARQMFSTNGKLYVLLDGSAYGEKMMIINPATNSVINSGITLNGSISNKQVGTKIYLANYFNGNIQVFDMVTDTVTSTFNIGGQPKIFAENNSKLYISDNNGYYVKVLDTATNTVTATIYHPWSPSSAVVYGSKMYVTNSSYASVTVIDVATNTWIQSIPMGSTQRNSMAIGNKLYVLTGFNVNTLKVIDMDTGSILSSTDLNAQAYAADIKFVNGKILLVDFYGQSVEIIDQVTNQVSKVIPIPYYPGSNTIVENKMYISSGNKVYVLDITAEQLIQPCPTFGTANSISGTIGQPFPSIQLYSNSVPNNTNATFVPQGSSTTITGKIPNNSFVPDSNQVIPNDVIVGNSVGTLSSPNIASLTIATNFSNPIVAPPTPPTPLAVTINQSTSQLDPTSTTTAKFTAEFSEPIDVSSFDISDMILSGTATGKVVNSITQVAPNNGTTFEIDVSSTGQGTIIAEIPAGQYSYSSSTFANVGSEPHGIAIDQYNNIYTANYNSGTISKITTGGLSTIVGSPGSPVGIAVDPAGNIYTANRGAYEINKTNTAGVTTIISNMFQYAFNVALDSLGNVFAVSPAVYGVRKITSSGNVSTLNTNGNSSFDVVTGADNSVYVLNQLSNDVTKITPYGYSYTLGSTGNLPQGIAVDSNNNVYTSNWADNNVTKITPDGASSILGTTGTNPFGIITDSFGNVYTTNHGSNNVTKITPDGGSTIIGTTGNNPRDITIDTNGNIYTSNTYSNNVTKIAKNTPTSGIKTLSNKGNQISTSVDNSVDVGVALTLGSYTGPLNGIIGQPFPSIILNNNTVANNTAATFVPQSSNTTITGKIQNNRFVPNPNQNIPSDIATGNSTGILKSNGVTELTIDTNFVVGTLGDVPVTIGGMIGDYFPFFNLVGSNLPDALFNPPGTEIKITFSGTDKFLLGKLQGSYYSSVKYYYPYGRIPLDATIGPSTATLSVPSNPSVLPKTIITNFTDSAIDQNIDGQIRLSILRETDRNTYYYDQNHYAIVNFQVTFDRPIDPNSFSTSDIAIQSWQNISNTYVNNRCTPVKLTPNSEYPTRVFDFILNCGKTGPAFEVLITIPQGMISDGNTFNNPIVYNNGYHIVLDSNLGEFPDFPDGLDANYITVDIPSINQSNINNITISGKCNHSYYRHNIYIDATGETGDVTCDTTNHYSYTPTIPLPNSFLNCIVTPNNDCKYYVTMYSDPGQIVFGATNYSYLQNLGSYVGPLTGTKGVVFPTIFLNGSTLPDNTLSSLTLTNSITTIQGKIIGGNFVPDSNQVIPNDVVIGNSTGTLSSPNIASLNITTNFSNPIVLPPPVEPYPAACSNRIIDTAQNYSNDFRTDIRVLGGNKLYIAGSRAGNSSLYEIKIIDVNTNQIVGNIQTPSPVQNLFFINGKLYAAMYNPLTYNSERISVIDPISGLELSSISISQTRSIKSLGSKIFVATSNSIVTIDTSNDAVTNTMGGFVNPEITFATNGKLYIGNQGSTMVVDITSSTIVKTLPFYIYKPFQVNNLLYIPGIKVLDTITDTVVADIPINAYQRDLIVKGDKLFLLGDSYSSKLMTIDLNTNTLVATTDIETGNNANEIIYGGGEIMVIKNSTYDAKLFFIDPLNGSITKTIPMDRQLVTYIAIRNRTYLIEGLGPVVLDTDIRDYQQPCPTLGTANEITGYAGLNFPSIYLNGNNAPNNTPATLSLNGSSQIISGTIIDNQFVPNPNQTIAADATFGNSTGTLSALGYSSIVVPTNLSASPNLGSYIGPLTGNIGDYFPYIFLNGSNVPDGTPASLVLPGSTNMMMGTIQNGYFAVNSYQTIPSDVTIGPATGILSTSITPSLVIPTDFGIETINGSFQAPYPSIINYDDNHDAIVKYEIVFSKNILVSSFTPDDITFGFFQGCNVVLISPYISNFSTNRFEIVLNCGHDLLNDGATIYPQLQAGVVTNGISTNGNFAGRGTTSTLKYTPATLITIDVPVLINSVNQTNFAITGSCVNGFDVNVYVNMTSENLTATCDNSTYFVSPQLIAQCFNDYYGNCNYTATVNQVLSGISDNADGTIGSSDYGILNNQTGGNIYITPQVQINGTNYLYNNTPNLGYFCSDNQNYTLTTSYGNTFSGYCEVNTGNSINIAPNFPNPLPNGPISITGTSTDLFGNTQNISYQGEVCNDPNFSVVTESQSYFNFGTIKASAQNLPSCIPNCNITSNISQYLGSLFSPIIGHAQNSATCSVTVEVPTIINQNNYQNFNITGTCVVGFDVNVIVALTAENLTATCEPDGTYSVMPTLVIVSAYAGCGVNFYNSCSFIATASQNVNGQTTTTSDTGIFDNFVDGQIVGDKTVSIGGINYVYAQPTYYNYNCGDAQSVTLSVDSGQSFTNTCSDSGTFDFLNKIPSTLVNGTINISGNTIDQRGNTKAINYQIEVCLDPSYNNSLPSGFLNVGAIKASAAPSGTPRPNCTTTISTSSSSQSSISIASSSISTSSSSSSQSSIEQSSSVINSLSSTTSSNVSSSSSDSCIIVVPLIPSCQGPSSSSSVSESSVQSSSIGANSSTISSTVSSSVSSGQSSVEQNSSTTHSVINSVSSSVASSSISTAQSSANEDQDNIPTIIEDLAPNNGDGNRDGIKDGEQSNVTSLNDPITNRMVTIEINPFVSVSSSSTSSSSNSSQSSTQSSSQSSQQPGCEVLNNVSIINETDNLIEDAYYDYPVGLVNFESSCASKLDVKIYWYGLDPTKNYINRKFKQIGQDYTTYSNINALVTNISGQDVYTYNYTVYDNSELDEDPRVGYIKDPVGPALVSGNVTQSGGVIAITNTSSITASSISSLDKSTNVEGVTNNIIQSIIDTIAPIEDTQIQSDSSLENINTVRTGGVRNYNYIFGIVLIITGIGLLLNLSKSKQEN